MSAWRENHTYIKLYGYEDNPLLLPIFLDKFFVVKFVENIILG